MYFLFFKKQKRGRKGGKKEKRAVRENQRCSEIVLTWTDATEAAANGGSARDRDTTDVTCCVVQ